MTQTPPDPVPPCNRGQARLDRQLDRLGLAAPRLAGWLARLRSPGARLVRIPLAVVLIFCGFLGFLPVLGFWMVPVGLLLLAIDVPVLQTPVAGSVVRGRRWWSRFRR